jgi:hypothetical protein
LAAAFVLGCAAAVSGFVFGMPGNGEFVPLTWLAGGAAIIVAPGWRGFVALLAGATVAATFLDVLDGVFGLVWLIVAIVVALAGHGALSASVLLRLRALGWRLGLKDPSVLRGGGVALGLALISIWVAQDLARNPP